MTTLYRVMGQTLYFEQPLLIACGPLRKSLQSAVRAAERLHGYVLDVSSGQRVYQAGSYLAHPPRSTPSKSTSPRRDRLAFVQAQLFAL